MNPLVATAVQAQRAAIDMAISRGDHAEEAARRRSLAELSRRERSTDTLTEHMALGFSLLVRQMEPNDGLRKLIVRGDSGIGYEHLRAAFALRDHLHKGHSGASEITERVDGGNIHNAQMEGLIDRRRKLRYSLNAAVDAVQDSRLMPVAIEIILHERTPRSACDRHGVTWGGRMTPRICVSVVEALDAAAAHIGVAR